MLRKATSATPAFLLNLGKATLRGIRKCPQCGLYNGTRGLSCKNKACGIVLRDSLAGGRSSKKGAVEVVKVGSGGGVQVFSVCQRGRGNAATQLGFVELVPTDTAIATGDGATLLTRINLGHCFLPSCRQHQRSTQGQSLCMHIKQAMECQSHATPLKLKSSVLEGLQASVEAKEELWRLATESPGPLVQRVSKDVLVVKCHTDSNHPLGLLHLTVGAGEISKMEGRGREGHQQQQAVYHCACQVSTRRAKPDGTGQPGSSSSDPCLHFYACVCAFASDDKLASDFAAFINYSSSGIVTKLIISFIFSLIDESCTPAQHITYIVSFYVSVAPSVVMPSGVGRERVSPSSLRKPGQRKAPGGSGLKTPGSAQFVDEHTVTMGFHQWLASVTERIHQTMHYQFDGKPDPLVYHIPQEFFNALQHRLSLGSKKRRLPNTTTAFVRNDGLPLGSFSKYTWHITNLMQVKRIFDTPELPLELTQSFVKNIDGSYSPFRCQPPPEPEAPEGYRTDRPQAIRPMELRTFLKVGICTADQKEACPFVIEWIPDILPRSRVGELRICFEFGHQQSGQPEYYDGQSQRNSGTERRGRNKSLCVTTITFFESHTCPLHFLWDEV
uniref:Chromosome 2 open reading frame 42 n=1 Tax=Myripristis murdjan TaxID=586833 RepID=A0A667XTB0_9TELE